MRRLPCAALGSLLAFGCGEDPPGQSSTFSRDQLLDPATCAECHPAQHAEWSGSMHAYAAEDPVFRAMNARGQRETGGALGDFCVGCHAPLAVREGLTTDGLNLDDVPAALRGVTCYFCHNVESVTGTHNAALKLANDTTMRGSIPDPLKSKAHRSKYSPLFDRRDPRSAELCGSCHDIVLPSPPAPAAVHLERTYLEWTEGLFSGKTGGELQTCNSCHMLPVPNSVIADVPGAGVRPARYTHDMVGVDLALTSFPRRAEQRQLTEQMLDVTLRSEICLAEVPGGFVLEVLLDNVGAGHRFPSGAAHDRRVFTEVIAYEGQTRLYQSGVVADGEPVVGHPDPELWLLREGVFKSDGSEAHMFWDVASTKNDCSDLSRPGCTIPGPVTIDKTHPDFYVTHVSRRFPQTQVAQGSPDRVTLRVRLRPVGLDVLDDLVASGDLAPAIRDEMQTLDLLPNRGLSEVSLEWTTASAQDPLYGFERTLPGLGVARCVSNARR
ncbi:MAG: cytochrome c family protein [Polyangiaceae bacterium]|nr:cytochrome c family protein [Polyangiaceae bacterium]